MPARRRRRSAAALANRAGEHESTGAEGTSGAVDSKKELLAGSQWVRAPSRIPRGCWLEASSSRIHRFLCTPGEFLQPHANASTPVLQPKIAGGKEAFVIREAFFFDSEEAEENAKRTRPASDKSPAASSSFH